MAATLYCPNYNCQAPNPENHKYCEKCRTLLPKRYLWAIEQQPTTRKPGDIVGDRYLFKQQQIWLDTKPGSFSETPLDVPPEVLPYLKLVPYQLHIPHPYDWLEASPGIPKPILLLENIPLNLKSLELGQASDPLAPSLTQMWPQASALRQLNWLWQIAQLWQPFSLEGVADSLLDPSLLRVEGQLIRILELRPAKSNPKLQQLGQLWLQWANSAQPEIASFLQQLSQQLAKGEIKGPEQLVILLDQGLKQVAAAQSIEFQMATLTDTGPSRRRNEDACYPISGTQERLTFSPTSPDTAFPLVIVCDGIGGHEGGNVASNLAIETVQQRIQQLRYPQVNPNIWQAELEQAVCDANDSISQRNDEEKRHERQRMGTTLVMALAQGHEMYITHVGDSRVYWITANGCHQVTLDDDVAAREVRLGYAFYRDAVQHPGAGSLVQALGMSESDLLHPTVQRFILDSEGVFLLCSDGLSDGDRVEEYWESEILPIFRGEINVAAAAQRLVEIANTQNGHDNVTVGLLHYRLLSPVGGAPVPTLSQTAVFSQPPGVSSRSGLKTQLLPSPKSEKGLLSLLLGIIVLLGLGLPVAYFTGLLGPLLAIGRNFTRTAQTSPPPSASPSVLTTPQASPEPVAVLEPRSLIQISDTLNENEVGEPNPLFLLAGVQAPENGVSLGEIPANSLLQVQGKQVSQDTEIWLRLKVCSVPQEQTPTPTAVTPSPTTPPSASPFVSSGRVGWVRETDLLPRAIVQPPAENACL